MSKTISMTLSTESINAAIEELRDYQKWLERKADELRDRVAYFIAKDASSAFQSATVDALIGEGVVTASVNVVVEDKGDVTVVIANGEDAVFAEFGAGVYYNGSVGSSPNPLGAGLGFTIGSYGQGKGAKEIWSFNGRDGALHLTHGAPASMPMYKAMMSVIDDLAQIAKAVFRS